ncbi:aminotransferase class V-fold PLP-dependent enzyme [Paracoccaceae bacterium]|nr:aminotransferase class V-fold PLP-dependent enzyme [Paracoccaceae bacterium]
MVPFIDLTRYEPGFLEKWYDTVSKMSASAQFIGGNQIESLEYKLKKICNVTQVISCANGTDAIQLALRAIGVGSGDEVIVPDLTFWATFEAVVNVGASPITVDISLSDGGIDFEAFKQAIKIRKPKAALIAHLYGWGTGYLDEIRQTCEENGVLLVEDGAQCLGVTWKNESIFSDAFIATTSFYPAKVFGAAGDAGAVFTSNTELAEKVRSLSNHGRSSHYGYQDVGWNSRMDSLQAAFLNLSYQHLRSRIKSRKQNSDYYRTHIESTDAPFMSFPDGYEENGYCNVMVVNDQNLKSDLESALQNAEIGFGNIYPSTLSEQACTPRYSQDHFGGRNASKLSQSVLNLPLFPYMTEAELGEVVLVVNSVL